MIGRKRIVALRGSDARLKRKKAKEIANNQKENLLNATIEILQDAQCEDRLLSVANHRATRGLLETVIQQSQFGPDYRRLVRQALQTFRNSRTTRDNLTRDEANCLDLLSQADRFTTAFKEELPAVVVSSEAEGSGGQRSRHQQDRRDAEQQAENDAKELLCNA